MKQGLSEEQREAVFFNDCEGALLVEASAGSGKTRILTERVRYLLTEKKERFFSVLCLTFTNRAAREMQERLSDIPNLKERAFVGNFHSFCLQKILRPRRALLGFDDMPHIFENEDDRKEILESVFLQNPILDKYYKEKKSEVQKNLLRDSLEFVSKLKRDLVSNGDLDRLSQERQLLYQDYNEHLLNQNAMDYDDILLYTYRLLVNNPHITNLYRRDYRYILVDEAQDLNYAQYQILKTLCGDEHKNVLMVGDPKQAIYGFNGASTEFMQKYFVADFEAKKLTVKHNYRSSKRVLKLAQKVQKNGSIGTNYFEGEVTIQEYSNEEEEAQWVIQKVKKWLEKGAYQEEGKCEQEEITYKNIGILARNRYVFNSLIKQLELDPELANKFALRKGVQRFEPESILMRVFDLGLRVLVNPKAKLHFKQVFSELELDTPTPSEDLWNHLLKLKSSGVLSNDLLSTIITVWKKLERNPRGLSKTLEEIKSSIKQQKETQEGEEMLKANFDIEQMQKHWDAFIRQEARDRQDITNFRYFLALNATQETSDKLTLATVHTSKGLEFEIVFLMGMNQGTFPDYRAVRNRGSALDEEQNNAYVAITRAKRCLYITYPKQKMMPWGDLKAQEVSEFLSKEKIVQPIN